MALAIAALAITCPSLASGVDEDAERDLRELKESVATGLKAGDVAKQCRQITMFDNGSASFGVPDKYDTGLCVGLFTILRRLQEVPVAQVRETGSFLVHKLCLPEAASKFDAIHVYVRHVDRHPETRHRDFLFVVLDAMAEAYPCPSPSSAAKPPAKKPPPPPPGFVLDKVK
jgi:hypothetical protein